MRIEVQGKKYVFIDGGKMVSRHRNLKCLRINVIRYYADSPAKQNEAAAVFEKYDNQL